ncbi:MAG: sigma-70 family RNA polymerase sigma factor [Planctomycetes bacterium]|nr:sigma-70 family RNA polymerase sigma factor [Planctomycetota bacterium]
MDTATALRRLAETRDAEAWGALLEQHGPAIQRVCRRVLRDPALAEDACQETLLQVRALAGTFSPKSSDPEASASAWVLQVACHAALHILRKNRRDLRRDSAHAAGRTAAEPSSTEAHAMNREAAAALHRELANLPEAERTPIVLHYFGELGYADLAAALGCPVGTAKARVSRGVDRLRQRLALLGLILAAGECAAALRGSEAQAAEAAGSVGSNALTAQQLSQWKALLNSPRTPAIPTMAAQTGVSTIMKISLVTAFTALIAALAIMTTNGRSAENKPQETSDVNTVKEWKGDAVNGLKLELAANKKTVSPGDTLTFTIKLKNITDGNLNVLVGYPIGALGKSVFERGDVLRLVPETDGALGTPLPYQVLVGIGPGVDFVTIPANSQVEYTCVVAYGIQKIKAYSAAWTKEKAGQNLAGYTFGRPTQQTPQGYPEFFLPADAAGTHRFVLFHEVTEQHNTAATKNGYGCKLDEQAPYWSGKVASNAVQVAVRAKTEVAAPVKPEEIKAAVEGANAFAFGLYGKLRGEKGNLFFSPFSIGAAMTQVMAGAKGHTAVEIANVLHAPVGQALEHMEAFVNQDSVHPAFGALLRMLDGAGKKRSYRLSIANSLWMQEDLPFEADFVACLKENYASGLQAVDFKKDPEAARKRINAWVEEKTRKKITDILAPDSIKQDAKLAVANAIYFKSAWKHRFPPGMTANADFTLMDGTKVKVPMMTQREHFKYGHVVMARLHVVEDGFDALEMPYTDNELSMLVLVPFGDMGAEALTRDMEDAVASGKLDEILKDMKSEEVSVFLPRFKMTWSADLKDTLIAMGMKDAFTPGKANFSGMTKRAELSLGLVAHKAFVEVNEEGTEAAAATVAVGEEKGESVKPKEFHADRPFVFLIRENATGAILFMGRVADPREQQ